MQLAHLADVHLGYRAYRKTNEDGVNQREADVERAWMDAVDQVVEAQPDAVLIAGDLYHISRPYPRMIDMACLGIIRLREGLGEGVPILIAGGNHETPKSKFHGNAVRLLRHAASGLWFATDKAQIIGPDEIGAGIAALLIPERDDDPDRVAELADELESRYNGHAAKVLVMHGAVDGRNEKLYHHGGVPVGLLKPERWDYVALGDYHMRTQLAPNAYYSGSLEWASSDIWGESRNGPAKGWTLYDTDTGEATHIQCKQRDVIDLPTIDGAGLPADDLNEAIKSGPEVAGGIEGKVVRQVVTDVARGVHPDVDWAWVREQRAKAVHFQLDLHFHAPGTNGNEAGEDEPVDMDGVDAMQVATIEEELHDLADGWEYTPGVDSDKVIETASRFLTAARSGTEG